ncbi:hypothetical protein [Spirosoma foliorum]|uniref:Uncharacterized protein n=1 Tax=Spirosoma foliorum TaxID=2710596 RepID=A0A7G5H6B2_9BACT|nr:hypothetical protein [Spirosoma foliorum]QMW06654.1 hypothetical protein H3H32_18070 [Spirosoma foliorum]
MKNIRFRPVIRICPFKQTIPLTAFQHIEYGLQVQNGYIYPPTHYFAMQLFNNQSSQPSFEYRLMNGIRKAIPQVVPFIEVDDSDHVGIIITLWDEQTDITIHYKLLDSDIQACAPEDQSAYIATIVKDLKAIYTAKKAV